jgi:hypothetical protein
VTCIRLEGGTLAEAEVTDVTKVVGPFVTAHQNNAYLRRQPSSEMYVSGTEETENNPRGEFKTSETR